MRHLVTGALLALLVGSCAPSLPYGTDYPLQQRQFHSRDGLFTGSIPVGWFSSAEDSLAPALTAWLIREDYRATVSIKELKLDNLSREQVLDDGLKLLASLNAVSEQHSAEMRDVKEFTYRGREYCGYEFGASGSPSRAVVFASKGKFYACIAQYTGGSWSREDFNVLFRAQQSVLLSLSF